MHPIATLSMLFVLALGLFAIFDLAVSLSTLFLGLLAYLLFHLKYLAALDRWLENPKHSELPQGIGLWNDIFYNLQRLQRRQNRNQVELSEVLERFQTAAQAMPDGIVMLNAADQIIWCNLVSGAHFGLDSERDHGQFIRYLIRQAQFTDYLNAQNYSEPLFLKSPINRDTSLTIQLVPYGQNQKLLISRDVTQIERIEAMRRDFVANVSHELRTPLTVVGGFLESFADSELLNHNELRSYLRLMREQTQRMQRLIEDLLTLSRLENNQSAPHEDCVDIPALAHSLHEEAKSLSNGKHDIQLVIDADACLRGTYDELRSALGNLISNAVRYTPEGGKITLRWEKKGNEAVFSVEDTGDGIEAQHLPRLTERFYRVDRSRSRETGGTGLGLAIVKHVLTRHQARLEITSEPGKGSRFSAWFPSHRIVEQAVAAP
jgi:two-component system phosphate regulon sensor histidine kinase PhoR